MAAFSPASANKLRQSPVRDSPETGKIDPGEIVEALDGPTCAEGFAWWLVRSAGGKDEGWTAEGRQGESWLLRYVKRCGVNAADGLDVLNSDWQTGKKELLIASKVLKFIHLYLILQDFSHNQG